MKTASLLATASVVSALLFCVPASAEIRLSTGVVAHSRIPAPIISEAVVRLDVPHIRQGRGLCVPTSAAMILKYFGENHDPVALKKRAEEHKPQSQRNAGFTYWADMQQGLQRVGKNWHIRDYPKTQAGYEQGLEDIKRSLRGGRPVMIDVHLDAGHTFVVMGYNDLQKVVYIRDPILSGTQSRVLSYSELRDSWHNHRFSQSRSAFFSER